MSLWSRIGGASAVGPYAAAWLAEDWTTARQIVRARLTGAAAIATTAAMGAGRGDADRFTLVSAIARFREAFEEGDGPLGAAAERMVDDGASRLLAENEALRSATSRERAAFAPRFGLEGFAVAMLDSGSERHVLLREAAQSLDEALLTARGACPSLRTLRMFLHATLALDSQEATVGLEVLPTASKGDLVAQLSLWLNADLALLARRASAYEAAWAAAARAGGDALSRTIAGLASGAMLSRGAVDAIRGEPAALLLSLAMTYTPEHASALLDCGTQAQTLLRAEARQEVAKWAVQAQRVDDLEERVGVSILASFDAREGYREAENCGGLDLFSAWNVHQTATEARGSLREAAEKSIAAETLRRREAVRKAKALLEKARLVYEAAIEEARSRLDMESRPPPTTPMRRRTRSEAACSALAPAAA